MQFRPEDRTSTGQRLPERSSDQGIWAGVAPGLTSWQETLGALARVLPRFIDAASIDVYMADGESSALSRVLSCHVDGCTMAQGQPCLSGEGICGWVAQAGRSCSVPDVLQDPRCSDIERERGGALLAVPLLSSWSGQGRPPSAEARVLGVLCVTRNEVGAFSAQDTEQIESTASQVAALLDYARQFRRLQESVHESERRVEQQTQRLRIERDRADFLHHVAEELTRTLDLDRVLNRTLARVGQALGIRQGSILLLDPVSGYLVYRAALGRPIRLPQGGKRTRYKRGVGLGGWVLEHNRWAIVARLDQDPRWEAGGDRQEEVESALAVPLSSENEAVGVMLLFHPEPDHFCREDVALATSAANHITVAVKNAEMYRLIREQAERLGSMLREQRRVASQHRAILSSIADGLVVADEQDSIVVANGAAQRMMGIPADALIGQQVRVLFKGCPEDMQHVVSRALAQVALEPQDTQRDGPLSATIICGDRIIKASFTAMLDEGQRFSGTVIVLRDITAEQELAQAKNEFVSIVSHELRTPMTSIKGYTDLMLKGAAGTLNEQQQRFLSTVKANIDRMAELVQDLLDISRIEAGRIRLKLESLDIRQIVGEVRETVAEAVRERGLTLDIEVAPTLPKVRADKNRIIQVLLNLVSNAYRYTPAGGRITVSVFQTDGAIQVDVSDTGIGIAEDEQETIFERFYRTDHPLVRQQAGTGLGLPIARSLVEMHQGKLWLRSQINQGSTFSFTLPLAEAS